VIPTLKELNEIIRGSPAIDSGRAVCVEITSSWGEFLRTTHGDQGVLPINHAMHRELWTVVKVIAPLTDTSVLLSGDLLRFAWGRYNYPWDWHPSHNP